MPRLLLILLSCLLLPLTASVNAADIHHSLRVSLDPTSRSLSATDRITLPENAPNDLILALHANLELRITRPADARLDKLDADGRVARYRLRLADGTREIELAYQGRLYHPLQSSAVEQTRNIRGTAGLIDASGSFLAASSLWYAQFYAYPYLSFDLEIDLPGDWRSVSQGVRLAREETGERVRERWRESEPQEEIYLIAAPFIEYREAIGNTSRDIQAEVYLRQPDPALADRYLEATGRYIRMYERLLGPYPYGKFALVENFWETGYGMPSFTLLGPRVIRLPFIINSSYPHEILHNWWGNGVYIDFSTGNWSEGLTAYLADHLIKQQQGQDTDYRRQVLQKYRDYAAAKRDFALTEFRGRHSPATQAVGYGKTMMFFHMLRSRIGDDAFTRGLRQLYRDYRFRVAGFADLEQVFSDTADESLRDFFAQWVERVGAPELGLDEVSFSRSDAGYRLEFTLEQRQPGPAYQLDVPLAVSLEGVSRAEHRAVSLVRKSQRFVLDFAERPLRIDVDPHFDLFRKLARTETPAAFTELFGARAMTVILPRAAPAALLEGWQGFAQALGYTGPAVEVIWDDQIESLPPNRAVAVLGWQNRFADEMRAALEREGLDFEPAAVKTGLTRTSIEGQAFAWATRDLRDETGGAARAWITADLAAALPGVARKLPRYHRYSYVAFAGSEATNSLKGYWEIQDGPLTAHLQADSPRATLTAQPALIDPEAPMSQ